MRDTREQLDKVAPGGGPGRHICRSHQEAACSGRMFSLPRRVGPAQQCGLGFPPPAVGGRLRLKRDDLVRCERALSNLAANKLGAILYERCVPAPLLHPSPPPLAEHCQPTDMFIKITEVGGLNCSDKANAYTGVQRHRYV